VDEKSLIDLLQAVQKGETSPEDAIQTLRMLPVQRMQELAVDTHRNLRRGLPEVVFGMFKTDEQILAAIEASLATGENCLATRVTQAQAKLVAQKLTGYDVSYQPVARFLTVFQKPVTHMGRGEVLVMAAGTSDIPIAEEAACTCLALGNRVARAFDVGVAGLHRLLDHAKAMQDAAVIIVVAGMDGALPSVVAGLSRCPVVAVPTSVGYGTAFGGVSALLGMLNNCAGGVVVVNIDNGFGAGLAATLMNRHRPFDEAETIEVEDVPPLH
jgi:NCAIR mutase (PurE)-related protein